MSMNGFWTVQSETAASVEVQPMNETNEAVVLKDSPIALGRICAQMGVCFFYWRPWHSKLELFGLDDRAVTCAVEVRVVPFVSSTQLENVLLALDAVRDGDVSASGVADVISCCDPIDADDTRTEVLTSIGGGGERETEHDDVASVVADGSKRYCSWRE